MPAASYAMQIHLGPGKRAIFLEQVKKDVQVSLRLSHWHSPSHARQFLESLDIMDYSLLLLVHRRPEGSRAPRIEPPNGLNTWKSCEGGIAACGPDNQPILPGEIYYLGIIDFVSLLTPCEQSCCCSPLSPLTCPASVLQPAQTAGECVEVAHGGRRGHLLRPVC